MIHWSKEQLLRPAKHLTTLEGSTDSVSAGPKCLGCGKAIFRGSALGLCYGCAQSDPFSINQRRMVRRRSASKRSQAAPYNPDRPTCYYCFNYRSHVCIFGFPESEEDSRFACECLQFDLDCKRVQASTANELKES